MRILKQIEKDGTMNVTFSRIKKYVGAAVLGLGMFSCADMLDTEPSADLDKDRYYQNEFDADVAVVGIYGQVMALAEQYVVLNEVRADLMEPTMHADPDLVDLSNHSVVASDDNKYADPKPFYKVILNCNDVLEGLGRMREENRITEEQYDQRYSDIGAIRSWLYLQLGIHFGGVPYVTQSLESIDDVNNPVLFPKLNFPDLIDKLVEFMESMPNMGPYPTNITLTGTSAGYQMRTFFINKRVLLGDLYLWQGDYTRAAEYYREVMETTTADGPSNNDYYDRYRMSWGGNSPFNVKYQRNDDITTLIDNNTDGWRSIFGRTSGQRYELTEWVWIMHFDKDFAPQYPFVRLFDNQGSGEYQLKPSQAIINLWEDQTQWNGTQVDARAWLSTKNWGTDEVEIGKYTYVYDPITAPLEKEGRWFLERAGSMHLKFTEAANNDNNDETSELARALINNGIRAAYTPEGFSGDDNTDISHTLDLGWPYDFDGRQGDFPFFRGPWYRHQGIRGRAYLPPVEMPMELTGMAEKDWTEELILDESALELAFEGHRWPQLLRAAMRRDPSLLADRVYKKMSNSDNPETVSRAPGVRAKLNSGDWFLPFHWEE